VPLGSFTREDKGGRNITCWLRVFTKSRDNDSRSKARSTIKLKYLVLRFFPAWWLLCSNEVLKPRHTLIAMAAAVAGKPRVLLVGTGPTAAVIYDLLRSKSAGIAVIDKARGIGGRMSTSHSRSLGQRATGNQPSADLGAQYITSSHPIVMAMAKSNIVLPLAAHIEGQSEEQAAKSNWVAPRGISSIVKHLFEGTYTHLC
jgi:hypothetical protein